MSTATNILKLEQSCEKMIDATKNQDWELVGELDKSRVDLIQNLATLEQETLTIELETRINRILDLDRIIQEQVIEAWNQAKAELLSIQKARPGIEMYRQ